MRQLASSASSGPGPPTPPATIGCAPNLSPECSSAIAKRTRSSLAPSGCVVTARRSPTRAAATATWSFPRTISGSLPLRPRRPDRRAVARTKTMAKIDITVSWLAGEQARAAPLLLQLLRTIRDTGSIQRASAALGISYRNGWGLLESWSAELAHPLITKTRGRGTRLTDLGVLLLRC